MRAFLQVCSRASVLINDPMKGSSLAQAKPKAGTLPCATRALPLCALFAFFYNPQWASRKPVIESSMANLTTLRRQALRLRMGTAAHTQILATILPLTETRVEKLTLKKNNGITLKK